MVKRPLGVTLISYFYLFGACVLILTAIFFDADANPIGIAARFGLPHFPERIMRILVGLASLIMAYGYKNLKTWGFWLMIGHSALFGVISLFLSLAHNEKIFTGNLAWSIIILVYTIYAKRYFISP
ncbi:hypothetical protein [Metabacillus sp. RGM 3146]|uniref:hypothetical protein n=1 Tax=Metabacillus sp. RGM 3146 TaxID=3401092 RepID=UPI003B993605